MPNLLILGVNDFESWCITNSREDLLAEWDYTKNNERTPRNTMYGASYKAWWVCSKGHSFQCVMYNRAKKEGSSCPICANRQILVGYNDLATTHPQLAKEWHPSKNGSLTPFDVTCGSLKKVWWLLAYDDPQTGKHFDFEWEAIINNRALKGSGCPFLFGRPWPGFNDLETINPQLAKEWDTYKNVILPNQISPNDNRKFWWKCSVCGFEWKAKVSNRNQLHRGCPSCGKTTMSKSYRKTIIHNKGSLFATHPELAKEWHPTKNGMLTPSDVSSGCSDKVWWCLPYDDPETGKHFDFEWEATIASRCAGCGCPFFNGRLWKGFNDLTVTNPDLIEFWHPTKNALTPDNFTKGSHTIVWWHGKCGHEFQSEIARQCYHFSCPICAKEQQSSFPEQAVYFYIHKLFPDAINGDRTVLDGYELDIYIPSIMTAIEYDGMAWHKDATRDKKKSTLCQSKNIKLIRIREDGCEELNNNDITYCYSYGDWTALNSIISNICKSLSDQAIDINIIRDEFDIYSSYLGIKQQGSIGELYPDLIDLWHPTKNGTLTPFNILSSSDKKVWWIDKYGHEYKCQVKLMTRGGEHCPYCNNRKLLKGFNDLESRFPDIASEWAYDLNGISPSEAIYNKGKFWFRCNTCGNTWKAYLSNRTRLGVGCPACGHVKQRNIRASKNNDDHYGKSLSVAYPELALEWNKTKNGIEATEVFGFSTLKAKYWWKCNKCDYEWQSTIKNRTRGRACPMCSLSSRHKMVRNIDTDEVFSSVNDAAEKYHCSASSITNCCKGRNSTCMGYHWEYYSYNE